MNMVYRGCGLGSGAAGSSSQELSNTFSENEPPMMCSK